MADKLENDPFEKLRFFGDQVEKHLVERIKTAIPAYAQVWVEYVGNNGGANALPMHGTDEDANKSRDKHWQRFYTILESLVLCWDIEQELHGVEEIKSFKSYAKNLNLWMAFYSHLGRIHDMVKATAKELNRPEVLAPFDAFWKERHIVLHGPKVPMKWIYNTLAVPSLGDQPKHWNDKMVWQDFKSDDFELLAGEVSKILRALEDKLNRYFAEQRKTLPDIFGWKRVSWPDDEPKLSDEVGLKVQAYLSKKVAEPMTASDWSLPSGTLNISSSKRD